MPRILLVDDDRDHLALFKMVLQGGGYSVDSFSDPAAALSNFKPDSYDLLLLDYRMPNINGYEFYEQIREMSQGIKALLITATHEQIIDFGGEDVKDHGNVRILRKPVSNEDLLREVNSILK